MTFANVRPHRWLAALAVVGVVLSGTVGFGAPAVTGKETAVAAAAELSAALPEVAALFKKSTGKEVKITYGSSENFAEQIQNGAPFEVFLSSDESYAKKLAAAGKTAGDGALYAAGRIGIFQPKGSPVKADAELKDLAAAVKDGRLQKFAIANPEHAPYGRAAMEALQHAGLWEAIQPKLIQGENVAAQATQTAQGGILPLSVAMTPEVKGAGTFVLIPADWHKPVNQRAVVLKDAGATAKAFYDFLQTPSARTVLKRHGFLLPGEKS